MQMRSILIIGSVLFTMVTMTLAESKPAPDSEGWEVLFDGKNLDAFDMEGQEGIWAINKEGELYPAKPGRTLLTLPSAPQQVSHQPSPSILLWHNTPVTTLIRC